MADDKDKDNVVVTSDKSRDPQLVLTLATKDGTSFDAKIEVDLVVFNVNNERVIGHAYTLDYVRDSSVTIPVNFNDRLTDWKRVCGMPGARLAYRAAIHLLYKDGSYDTTIVRKHLIPTYDPPITLNGIENQFANDVSPDRPEGNGLIPVGTKMKKGDVFHCPNGIFYLSFQEDGNLVVKAIDGEHFWWGSYNDAKAPMEGEYAKVHEDGNLHIYNANNELMWRTDVSGGVALSINTEGHPVILNDKQEEIWEGTGGMNAFHREMV